MKAHYKYFILAHFPPWFYKKGFEEKSMNNVFTRMEIQGYKFGENIKINITVPRQGKPVYQQQIFLNNVERSFKFMFTYFFIYWFGWFLFSPEILWPKTNSTQPKMLGDLQKYENWLLIKVPLICCQPIQLVFMQLSEPHTLRVCLNPRGSPLLLASSVDNMRVCTQVRERVQHLLWISHWSSYT